MGLKPETGLESIPGIGPSLAEDLRDLGYADVKDLMKDIGYAPSTSLDEGIGRFVDWYLEYYGR